MVVFVLTISLKIIEWTTLAFLLLASNFDICLSAEPWGMLRTATHYLHALFIRELELSLEEFAYPVSLGCCYKT